ncbi:MAG: substrate-binding domain-containing protein, partial [Ruminococcus sp.]|nr:substrate-binding domain-containing protein [Ruminococcus sp.]
DNLIAGQDAAREMLTRFKERGLSVNEEAQVCIQVGATSSQTINERLAGFLQYWTNNAPEAWEVVDDIRCNEGDAEIAVDLAEDIIDDYSENIKGVFGTNNGSTAGFARVVADRERTDITVVGFDYSEDIAKLINSEEYDAATMVQRQFQMSYGGVDEALKLIRGEAV